MAVGYPEVRVKDLCCSLSVLTRTPTCCFLRFACIASPHPGLRWTSPLRTYISLRLSHLLAIAHNRRFSRQQSLPCFLFNIPRRTLHPICCCLYPLHARRHVLLSSQPSFRSFRLSLRLLPLLIPLNSLTPHQRRQTSLHLPLRQLPPKQILRKHRHKQEKRCKRMGRRHPKARWRS